MRIFREEKIIDLDDVVRKIRDEFSFGNARDSLGAQFPYTHVNIVVAFRKQKKRLNLRGPCQGKVMMYGKAARTLKTSREMPRAPLPSLSRQALANAMSLQLPFPLFPLSKRLCATPTEFLVVLECKYNTSSPYGLRIRKRSKKPAMFWEFSWVNILQRGNASLTVFDAVYPHRADKP